MVVEVLHCMCGMGCWMVAVVVGGVRRGLCEGCVEDESVVSSLVSCDLLVGRYV
jgi:hypothetical protein